MQKNILILIAVALCTLWACKKDVAKPSQYFPQVRSIVQNNCTQSCHAPSKGFFTGLPVILEADTNIVHLAASIKAAVADPIGPTNKRMPEGGSLSTADIDLIKNWFAKGGKLTD